MMKRIIGLILLLTYCMGPALVQAGDHSVDSSLAAFDSLPADVIAQALQLQGLNTGDPLALTQLAAPGSINFVIPSEIVALLEMIIIAKQIWGTFNELKSYWEELYGSVKYVLTKQFWVAQILDPLKSCLPKGGLFFESWPPDPTLEDIKEFLAFIAGQKPYLECSSALQNQLTAMIGGIPHVYDINGNVIPSPNFGRRSWQIYEAANNAPKQVAAARNSVPTIVADADRIRNAITLGENIPKNIAMASGSILRATASETELEATRVALAAQDAIEELAAQKALEEASSASMQMFGLVPQILVTGSQDQP